jgi:hypothetical protein
MTYVLKINGKSHNVDVDGDLPFSGTQNPLPRIRMLDGFYGRSAVKDTTTLDSVIAELVEASRAKAAA